MHVVRRSRVAAREPPCSPGSPGSTASASSSTPTCRACAPPISRRSQAPPRAGALALVAAPTARRTRSRCPFPGPFAPLYGAGSAARFRAHAVSLGLDVCDLELDGLREDVDTVADLERTAVHAGPRTRSLAAVLGRVSVVLLSGGVGGAKLAAGLHDVLAPGELTVIGNVGDDLEVLGLHVSPDLDSVLYGLAGLNDTERGWGRAGETWQALESARAWGGEGWFMLGDLDLGLHLVRSQALRDGEPLSAVTARLDARSRSRHATRCRPPTIACGRTSSLPRERSPSRSGSSPGVTRTRSTRSVYDGADASRPAPGVLEALAAADAIVIAPSNPFVSIHPILAVPGIRAAIETTTRALRRSQPADRRPRGPRAARPHDAAPRSEGRRPAHVTMCYEGLLDALVIDRADAAAETDGAVVVTDTLMTDRDAARRLAQTTLEAAMEVPA